MNKKEKRELTRLADILAGAYWKLVDRPLATEALRDVRRAAKEIRLMANGKRDA